MARSAIYHCAAPPYHKWVAAFPALQKAALAAAEATGAVLIASENLYGYGVAGTLTEDMPLTAATRKGALTGAVYRESLLAAHASGRAQCVAGRATDFFGPGVRVSALGERFWPALLAGKPVDWVGDPDARHSFAYLPDLAAAYVTLAQTPSALGRAWHSTSLAAGPCAEICRHGSDGRRRANEDTENAIMAFADGRAVPTRRWRTGRNEIHVRQRISS